MLLAAVAIGLPALPGFVSLTLKLAAAAVGAQVFSLAHISER